MTTATKPILSVRDTILERAQTKKDYKVSAHRLSMNGDGTILMPTVNTYSPLRLTDWSSTQLFSKLQMPGQYFKKLLRGSAEEKQLIRDHVNYHLEHSVGIDEVWFLRTYGSSVARAFLSDRYSKLDDDFVAESLTKMMNHDHTIKMFNMDDHALHLRIVFPDLTVNMGKLKDGRDDIVQVGIHIINSEVGAHSLTVEGVLYRQVCTNGLVIAVSKDLSLQQRHVYLREYEIQNRLHEALSNCIEKGHDTIDAFRATKEVHVAKPLDIIDKLAKDKKYSDKFTDSIKTEYSIERERSGDTQFTLLNALTSAAKQLHPDDRVEVEKFAGKLVNETKLFSRE